MDYSAKPGYTVSMNHFSDDELRRLLFAEPANMTAVAAAVNRFLHPLIKSDEMQQVREILNCLEDEIEAAIVDDTDVMAGALLEDIRRLQELLHVD